MRSASFVHGSKPLHMGAVMPSSKLLARTMAEYVDVHATGPVVELGPGTGAITNALIEHGVDQKRLVLVEYNPGFCALLRDRYPQAKVVQGDAYALRSLAQGRAGRAGFRRGLRPAAGHQADADAPETDPRRLHGAAPGAPSCSSPIRSRRRSRNRCRACPPKPPSGSG